MAFVKQPSDKYRQVEAMYHRGESIEDIQRATGMSKIQTLDTVQKIFALDKMKKEKR